MDKHTLRELKPIIESIAYTRILSEAILSDYVQYVKKEQGLSEEVIIERIKKDFYSKISEFIETISNRLYPPPTEL